MTLTSGYKLEGWFMTRFIRDCGAFVSLAAFATSLYLWMGAAHGAIATLA